MPEIHRIQLEETARPNYLYLDHKNLLHLLVPVVGGVKFSTDNTCQAAKELKDFCAGLLDGLANYGNQLSRDIRLLSRFHPEAVHSIKAKKQRLAQVELYIAYFESTPLTPDNLQSKLLALAIGSNLKTMVLNSIANPGGTYFTPNVVTRFERTHKGFVEQLFLKLRNNENLVRSNFQVASTGIDLSHLIERRKRDASRQLTNANASVLLNELRNDCLQYLKTDFISRLIQRVQLPEIAPTESVIRYLQSTYRTENLTEGEFLDGVYYAITNSSAEEPHIEAVRARVQTSFFAEPRLVGVEQYGNTDNLYLLIDRIQFFLGVLNIHCLEQGYCLADFDIGQILEIKQEKTIKYFEYVIQHAFSDDNSITLEECLWHFVMGLNRIHERGFILLPKFNSEEWLALVTRVQETYLLLEGSLHSDDLMHLNVTQLDSFVSHQHRIATHFSEVFDRLPEGLQAHGPAFEDAKTKQLREEGTIVLPNTNAVGIEVILNIDATQHELFFKRYIQYIRTHDRALKKPETKLFFALLSYHRYFYETSTIVDCLSIWSCIERWSDENTYYPELKALLEEKVLPFRREIVASAALFEYPCQYGLVKAFIYANYYRALFEEIPGARAAFHDFIREIKTSSPFSSLIDSVISNELSIDIKLRLALEFLNGMMVIDDDSDSTADEIISYLNTLVIHLPQRFDVYESFVAKIRGKAKDYVRENIDILHKHLQLIFCYTLKLPFFDPAGIISVLLNLNSELRGQFLAKIWKINSHIFKQFALTTDFSLEDDNELVNFIHSMAIRSSDEFCLALLKQINATISVLRPRGDLSRLICFLIQRLTFAECILPVPKVQHCALRAKDHNVISLLIAADVFSFEHQKDEDIILSEHYELFVKYVAYLQSTSTSYRFLCGPLRTTLWHAEKARQIHLAMAKVVRNAEYKRKVLVYLIQQISWKQLYLKPLILQAIEYDIKFIIRAIVSDVNVAAQMDYSTSLRLSRYLAKHRMFDLMSKHEPILTIGMVSDIRKEKSVLYYLAMGKQKDLLMTWLAVCTSCANDINLDVFEAWSEFDPDGCANFILKHKLTFDNGSFIFKLAQKVDSSYIAFKLLEDETIFTDDMFDFLESRAKTNIVTYDIVEPQQHDFDQDIYLCIYVYGQPQIKLVANSDLSALKASQHLKKHESTSGGATLTTWWPDDETPATFNFPPSTRFSL